MNYSKLPFYATLLTLAVLVFSCKDDDEPDPRGAFAGTYDVDELDVTVRAGVEQVSENFDVNAEIEFIINPDLDADEMEVDMDDFLEDMVRSLLAVLDEDATVQIEVDEMVVAEISGDEFEIDGAEVTLTVQTDDGPSVYEMKVDVEGELKDGELEIEAETALLYYILEVETTAEKQ